MRQRLGWQPSVSHRLAIVAVSGHKMSKDVNYQRQPDAFDDNVWHSVCGNVWRPA
jgi:hypothetical protein